MGDKGITTEIADVLDPPTRMEASRVHRRRLHFGRRLAIVLGGVVVIVTAVIWNRGVVRRNACHAALEHFSSLAREAHLGSVPIELMDAEWKDLDHESMKISAGHYELIPYHWRSAPIDDDRFPLAVCEYGHTTLLGRGRHVLYATRDGDVIEWVPEDQAQGIIEKASGGGQARP